MAANSKREQIILNVVGDLEELSSIKTVARKQQTHSQLAEFALTQLPVAAVVGRLPTFIEKQSGRRTGGVEIFVSKLAVDVYVYFQNIVDPDTQLSSLADDMWVKFYADQLRGGLALGTSVQLSEDPEYWDPFVAFKLTAVMQYTHGIGGI